MNSTWLYRQNPLWIIAVLLVVMTIAAELGFVLGRRWYPRTDEARRGHFNSILGSLLGLLALLLAFTFAMSVNRYDLRRQLVMNDANSLEGLYLLSSLLPDESRKPFKQSLRKYVDLRSQVALFGRNLLTEEVSELSAKAELLHSQMWKTAKDSAAANPPAKFAEPILKGLIDALAVHRARIFGWESRVPDSVICLLLLGCIAGMGAIGLSGGLGKHRGLPARVIVTVLLCATIYVVLDLDRPHEGLIRISQSPMLHLQSILDGDPETKP
jgi:hypothetical protein